MAKTKESLAAEMEHIEAQLEKMDRNIEASEKRVEDMAKETEEGFKRGMTERLDRFTNQYHQQFQFSLDDVGNRYKTHTQDKVVAQQTDVLRLNKVIRDISRSLGPNWRPVFQKLMASHPPEMVQAELTKIESQKPFMQAYNALTVWKDTSPELNMLHLVEALKTSDMSDLAGTTMDILESQGESLLTLNGVGSGITSGKPAKNEEAANTQTSDTPTVPGPIGDATFLRLSRKIGGDWMKLGQKLGMTDEELAEIKEAEGESYQAGFMMLWTWRDQVSSKTQDNVAILSKALTEIGKTELIQELK